MLRILGRKVVCDVHEDLAAQVLNKEWIPQLLRTPLAWIIRNAQWNLPLVANAVVLAEDSYKRNFRSRPNVSVIHNFPILTLDHKTDYQAARLRLVYVGDVRIVRGIETYVRVTHALIRAGVPAELRVIGSFADPHEEARILAITEELGIRQQVAFLGRQRPETVPSLLNECDVGLALLHPIGNYRESYPTKMFEYMSSGLPVVVSNFPLWEAVVAGSECGLALDPMSQEDAVRALKRYWDEPALRRLHGTNGRRAIVERYRWEIEVHRLLDMYSQLSA
jgi:glycosyltransferase involved in cell wall biosynthesis